MESLLQVASLEKDRGNLADAEMHYRRVPVLATGDDRAWYKYWAQLGLGDIRLDRGNLPEALKSYRDGLAIADRLAKADPGNAEWQRDLSVSYNKIGDVLVAQGDLPGALKSYRDSLAIAERLAKADPGNAGWQRDLSVSYEQDRRRAGGAGRSARGAANPIATASPSRSGWRRPTPATPSGSAICRCRTTRSATCWWRRATCPGR